MFHSPKAKTQTSSIITEVKYVVADLKQQIQALTDFSNQNESDPHRRRFALGTAEKLTIIKNALESSKDRLADMKITDSTKPLEFATIQFESTTKIAQNILAIDAAFEYASKMIYNKPLKEAVKDKKAVGSKLKAKDQSSIHDILSIYFNKTKETIEQKLADIDKARFSLPSFNGIQVMLTDLTQLLAAISEKDLKADTRTLDAFREALNGIRVDLIDKRNNNEQKYVAAALVPDLMTALLIEANKLPASENIKTLQTLLKSYHDPLKTALSEIHKGRDEKLINEITVSHKDQIKKYQPQK
jgi:hypothetical protein